MTRLILASATLAFLALGHFTSFAEAENIRVEAGRLETPETASQSTSILHLFPNYEDFFKNAENPSTNFRTYGNSKSNILKEEEKFVVVLEAANGIVASELLMMSMPTTSSVFSPSITPTEIPTSLSYVPTVFYTLTSFPTSKMPSTSFPTTATPSVTIKGVPISTTSPAETLVASLNPTPTPTTKSSTIEPTVEISVSSTSGNAPSSCGISADERSAGIFIALNIVADSFTVRNLTTPQGLATQWLIEKDGMNLCPTSEKLIQRWVLAVLYFATNGGEWFKCSGNPSKTDSCGVESPFVGSTRFLSDVDECQWAGILCNRQLFVTRVDYQENNLVGTIATEIGLLSDLIVLKMKMGGLTGTIPSEIGQLDELMVVHLDENDLTGTLPVELSSLRGLTQLDLDSNNLEGHIDIIDSFPELELLQLHSNGFTGSVPDSLGEATSLKTFTLHDTLMSGTMPDSVCELVESGVLTRMIADCSSMNPDIICTCCTDCRGQ